MNVVFKNIELNGKITDITVHNGRIVSLYKTNECGYDCDMLLTDGEQLIYTVVGGAVVYDNKN